MQFESIRDFFDHMKKKPARCDGLALEVLIRNVVNETVSGIRQVQQRDHEQTKKSGEMARADRARLEQVLLKLQALGTSLDRLARDAQEYNAKKSELEVLSEDFVHLDRHMKEKGNSLTAKVVNLENRTARLEKYVFDQEKPIL